MRQYGESKTTRIMMATVPHVTSGSGLRKFQADGIFVRQSVQFVYTFGLNLSSMFESHAQWTDRHCFMLGVTDSENFC